jgi:hypothetical protein
MTFPYYRSILFPTYENVGYPAPRGLWFSDLIGWTNTWHGPREWLWRETSVKHLLESKTIDLAMASLVGLVLILSLYKWVWSSFKLSFNSYRRSLKFNKNLSFNLIFSSLYVITSVLFSFAIGRFFILEYNPYLLTKSLSFVFPLLLLSLIYFLYRSELIGRLTKLLGVTLVISSLVFPTLQTGGVDDASFWQPYRGQWIPQFSSDQFMADLIQWLGLTPAQALAVMPNLVNFPKKTIGYI